MAAAMFVPAPKTRFTLRMAFNPEDVQPVTELK
jgi:hypothetical protein